MSAAENPVLFLSVETPDGEVCISPLFAAVQVTDTLVQRVQSLEPLCRQFRLLSVRFAHDEPAAPIYWEEKPGSRIEGYLGEYVEWCLMDGVAQATLWGRLQMGNGGHGPIEALARTFVIELHHLQAIRSLPPEVHPTAIDFSFHENWSEVGGCEFELEVLARVAELGREARRQGLPALGQPGATTRDHKPP